MLETPCQRERQKENPADRFSALNFSPREEGYSQKRLEKKSNNVRPSIPCFSLKKHIFFVFSASTRQRGKKGDSGHASPRQGLLPDTLANPAIPKLKSLNVTARVTFIATIELD